MPTIKALKKYPELQEKEGITLSVAPNQFHKKKYFSRKCEWIPETLDSILGNKEEDLLPSRKARWKVVETPYYKVEPYGLIFQVKIYNHLEHVLRLAGTVVAFQVEGKMISLDKANYQEFIDGFILPRQENVYKIIGPEIRLLPKECNIALFLYDIVTETDAAGNPTKRTNFEWFFTYKKEIKEEFENANVREAKMTRAEAKALERRKR